MIEAVLFDLDGVIVDACDWHYLALNKALGFDLSPDEHFVTYNGLSTKKKLELLSKEGRIATEDIFAIWDKKQKITQNYIKELQTDWVKVRLMQRLLEQEIKVICVTNAIRESAEMMLHNIGVIEYFEFIISNEDVQKNKPDPAPYLLAMKELKLLPKNILIVEDSSIGIIAARASGAHVLEVKNATEVTAGKVLTKIYEINTNENR